ncbi:MAG TPA: FtsX-like permease family protein [Gemmatimonadales bacterium]|nr:FtsX-like permease family protein [Gemmatimonadales bacterium]
MTRLRFLVAMAWRETRASRRRLLLFASAISLGVAALVAIGSFTANLQTALRRETRTLLGADLAWSSARPFSDAVEAVLDSARAAGIGVVRRTLFSSVGYVRRIEGRSRLVEVRAVGPEFPFYGEVVTSPAGLWDALDTGRVAIVDTALLVALDAEIGDTLELGRGRFRIAATVSDVPGHMMGGINAFGAQAYIPERFVGETGLIVFGSRVSYQALFRFPGANEAARFERSHTRLLDSERLRSYTTDDAESDITESLEQMSQFLQFVSLIALLLGGIGVASGVGAFLAGKLETIAVLRCLGARRALVFAIYLTQAVALGVVAAVAGAAAGVLVQLMLPRLLSDLLPVTVQVSLEPEVILSGIGIGAVVAVLFALRPLLEVRLVSPLEAIRKDYEAAPRRPRDPLRLVAGGLLLIGVFAITMGRHDDPKIGLGYAGAIIGSVVALTAAARIAIWIARRLTSGRVRARWPYVVRQGIANLHRPRNQTRAVVTSLGFGVSLLAALYLIQANFLRQILRATTESASRPNIVFVDIQRDQVADVLSRAESTAHGAMQVVPMVPMRIHSVNGRDVPTLLRDTTGRRPLRWTVRREYRSTWRDTLVPTERLVQGAWWEGDGSAEAVTSGGTRVYPVSLSTDVATDLKVTLGDTIVWNVQGLHVATRITSLREVDWASFQPNFFAVFPTAALASAPTTWVLLMRIEDARERALLQRRLAEAHPNVIAFDVAVIARTIDRIFSRIAIAVRFMAALSLTTGALVLLGAVAAGRLQRIREGALLKALGATRRKLSRILLSEYVALGVLASVVGIGLATATAWAFTKFVMEMPFSLPAGPLLAVFASVVVLVAVVGLTASREVFRRTAMEVLRDM